MANLEKFQPPGVGQAEVRGGRRAGSTWERVSDANPGQAVLAHLADAALVSTRSPGRKIDRDGPGAG